MLHEVSLTPSSEIGAGLVSGMLLDGIPNQKIDLLHELDNFDFKKVAKKTAFEYNMDVDMLLIDGIRELKRYYALRIVNEKKYRIAIPVKLDPMRHVHVLFTKEYGEFCDYFFGEMFHHWPCTPDDKEHMLRLGNDYKKTLNHYDDLFVARDKDWWPDMTGNNWDDICCGCSCAGQ